MITTDNQNEIFDIVDPDDNIIGQATRRECNSNPDIIHRAVFILIYNHKNQILWQKRSLTKDTCPGEWTTSVSGHVDSGDSYEEAAIRETMEELGIRIELEYMGKFLYRYSTENEYSAIFKGYSEGPFDFDKQEVADIEFMTIDEILEKENKGEFKLVRAIHFIIESLSL